MSIEAEFRSFLDAVEGAVNLDELPESIFENKKADYFLKNHNAVLEIKTIDSDRYDAFEPWINQKISNAKEIEKGMPVVFGTVNFQRIYQGHRDKKYFNKILDRHAARTLEDYIRSSKYQIRDTKQSMQIRDAIGILVILNQEYDFYDTGFVYRVIQEMLKKLKLQSPELPIDGVLYINESKSKLGEVDAVFIHGSDNLDVAPNEFLDWLFERWAEQRDYGNT